MLTDQSLSEAIARTLAYSASFNFHPSQAYVRRFLHSRWPVNPNKLRNISTYLSMPTRLAVTKIECQKWRTVAAAVSQISLVPWIQSIWVTGALAAGSVIERDDIDLMIITDPNRLWLSRLLVVGLGLISGRYRSHWLSRSRPGRPLVLQFWLEAGALALPVLTGRPFTKPAN